MQETGNKINHKYALTTVASSPGPGPSSYMYTRGTLISNRKGLGMRL